MGNLGYLPPPLYIGGAVILALVNLIGAVIQWNIQRRYAVWNLLGFPFLLAVAVQEYIRTYASEYSQWSGALYTIIAVTGIVVVFDALRMGINHPNKQTRGYAYAAISIIAVLTAVVLVLKYLET